MRGHYCGWGEIPLTSDKKISRNKKSYRVLKTFQEPLQNFIFLQSSSSYITAYLQQCSQSVTSHLAIHIIGLLKVKIHRTII